MATAATAQTAVPETAVPEASTGHATNDASNRLKGFLGMSAETVNAMDQTVVGKYKAMSDAELFAIGEKALGDIADDIIALDEIRNRFRKGHAILGYVNWKEFVQRNSKYSLRTVQRRLNEIHDKDEAKVNTRFKDTDKVPSAKTPVFARERVGDIYVWEETEVDSTDHSRIWLVENLKTGLAELWRTCDIRRLKNGETPKLNMCEMAYTHSGDKEAGLQYWAEKVAWAQERLAELKGAPQNSFAAAQAANRKYAQARAASANTDLQFRLLALRPAFGDGDEHAFIKAVKAALLEDDPQAMRQTMVDFRLVIKEFEEHIQAFERRLAHAKAE
jgi:hypothetical protein